MATRFARREPVPTAHGAVVGAVVLGVGVVGRRVDEAAGLAPLALQQDQVVLHGADHAGVGDLAARAAEHRHVAGVGL